MMENKYTRSAGFTPYDWSGYGPEVNHFQMGGGLGLRGYAGYVAPEVTGNGDLMLTYRGNSGAALNAELDVDGLLRIRPRATRDWLHIDELSLRRSRQHGLSRDHRSRYDQAPARSTPSGCGCGPGAHHQEILATGGHRSAHHPFRRTCSILSNLPYGETEHFAFRYVIGINRSF